MMLEKLEDCPLCGTGLAQGEYDSQYCGKCGWIRDARPPERREDARTIIFRPGDRGYEAAKAMRDALMKPRKP